MTRIFTSLRLTVACLAIGMVLVFAGTIAQVEMGLYRAQNEFFRSFFVYWSPPGAALRIPVFPGGYLVGGLLLINLIASSLTRFGFRRNKAGIWLVHVGLALLLVGQLCTDLLSTESAMHLAEGETKNYSQDFRQNELALIDKSDSRSETVYSIPESFLRSRREIRDARLPFTIRVQRYWKNASLVEPGPTLPAAAVLSGATAGALKDVPVVPEPEGADTDQRNTPAAVIELLDGARSAGLFMVSAFTATPQTAEIGGKHYEVSLRPTRYYYPFRLTLLKATHEKYKGTDIPKNFASRVRVQNPANNEVREMVIYMNNPLRYGGQTFYQYQMSAGELAARAGAVPTSTFQVVRNPGWLTPYVSCLLISLGLVVQFAIHLVGFARSKSA